MLKDAWNQDLKSPDSIDNDLVDNKLILLYVTGRRPAHAGAMYFYIMGFQNKNHVP